MLGVLLFSSLFISSSADATTYFSGLANDEKEEYTKWVDAHSSYYPRHTFMPSAGDPSDGAAFFWNINDDAVNFALAVRAEGWVGFGLSEAGGMIGSDMALITVAEPNLASPMRQVCGLLGDIAGQTNMKDIPLRDGNSYCATAEKVFE